MSRPTLTADEATSVTTTGSRLSWRSVWLACVVSMYWLWPMPSLPACSAAVAYSDGRVELSGGRDRELSEADRDEQDSGGVRVSWGLMRWWCDVGEVEWWLLTVSDLYPFLVRHYDLFQVRDADDQLVEVTLQCSAGLVIHRTIVDWERCERRK